ncbi:sulfotransferase family 2 domain-containing protein [Paracoccus aerodenitrificans]|uniref:sulfotransferase family 2 domain-containing protein n=1 Tax=Paracoccus aerodenitrificans TaxID=3017781 RepID=UPI0022F141B7|nr:sulfotransferase family 2 domain-containing protein [Paracoccus aerodenitrificans]WBU63240.1 sulfotransferase family 2 domain-containing protein [Paracoccus aerodenitrificans]
MRTVIVHYHIYKNAGTSFENMLDASFGPAHERFDGPFPFFTIDQDQLDRIIRRRVTAKAFSSHQTVLPQPTSLDYHVLAVLFLRHPVLRIGSIYRFKRNEQDGTSTSLLAKNHDFAGFIEACFAARSELPHISNGQTRQLSAAYGRNPLVARRKDCMEYDLATARRNLAAVDLLGRTEHFEADIRRFAPVAAAYGLTLTIPEQTRHNVTQPTDQPVAERVEAELAGLSDTLRTKLLAANAMDLELYDLANRLIAQPAQG